MMDFQTLLFGAMERQGKGRGARDVRVSKGVLTSKTSVGAILTVIGFLSQHFGWDVGAADLQPVIEGVLMAGGGLLTIFGLRTASMPLAGPGAAGAKRPAQPKGKSPGRPKGQRKPRQAAATGQSDNGQPKRRRGRKPKGEGQQAAGEGQGVDNAPASEPAPQPAPAEPAPTVPQRPQLDETA